MRGPTLDELLAVHAAASGAGATADDGAALAAHVVGRVLADASVAGGPRVSFANGVWVDASLSFKAVFAEITALAYKTEIHFVNFQTKLYRHVEPPGWRLSWAWAGDEVIWAMTGAETTEQGNCSRFRGETIQHCCEKSPVIVDLAPGTPYNMQVANCC